jgi:hypothetical protein
MASDLDPASPTALIMAYLAKQGAMPTSDNVRNALSQNARDPSLIPGLRADPVGADSGPGSGGPSVGQRGNVASKIESSKGPTSQDEMKVRPGETATTNGSPNTTSAQPGSSGGPNINIGDAITANLPLLGAAGAGAAGLYGLSRFANRPNYQLGLAPQGTDVAAGPPGASAPDDQYRMLPDESAKTPMQTAMDKAVAPAAGPPQLGSDVPDLTGVRPPPVQPSDVIGKPGLPPGITPTDAANVSIPRVGESLPLLPPRGAGGAVRPPARIPYVPRMRF